MWHILKIFFRGKFCVPSAHIWINSYRVYANQEILSANPVKVSAWARCGGVSSLCSQSNSCTICTDLCTVVLLLQQPQPMYCTDTEGLQAESTKTTSPDRNNTQAPMWQHGALDHDFVLFVFLVFSFYATQSVFPYVFTWVFRLANPKAGQVERRGYFCKWVII